MGQINLKKRKNFYNTLIRNQPMRQKGKKKNIKKKIEESEQMHKNINKARERRKRQASMRIK